MRENLIINFDEDCATVGASVNGRGWWVWSSLDDIDEPDAWKQGIVKGWYLSPTDVLVPHLRVLLLTGPEFEEINLLLRRPV